MSTINVSIKENMIFGNPEGEKLFAVIWVDLDDCEDTTVDLWRANDEDELRDLLVDSVGDGNPDYEPGVDGPDVEEEIGNTILINEIGSIPKKRVSY